MAKRPAGSKTRGRTQREKAAFGLMGAAFVKLLRDTSPEHQDMQAIAMDLADWLHLKIMTDREAGQFMADTGWVFASDLSEDEREMPSPEDAPPHGDGDDEIPF